MSQTTLNVLDKWFNRYFLGTFAYGFVRKVAHVSNATVRAEKENYNDEDKYIPMLTVDKASAVIVSTLLSPSFFPYYLYKDLSYLEIYIRQTDPKNYGYCEKNKSWYEYLF